VRVGVATALGLACALRVPVVPLSSLEVRAFLVEGRPRVLSLLDARKGRFYAGVYDTTGPRPVPVVPEGDLALESILSQVAANPSFTSTEPPFWAVGEGSLVGRGAIEAAGGRVVPLPDRCPAEAAAWLGLLGWRDQQAVAPEQVQVRYLRPADAVPPRSVPRPGTSQQD